MTVACRSCGAEVWWAWTTGGKRMPVDATPDPEGMLVAVDSEGYVLADPLLDLAIEHGQASQVTMARRAHRSMTGEVRRWTSHFATCPNAEKHRKKR